MKINQKHYITALVHGEAQLLPRKVKKCFLGKRLGRQTIGLLLAKLELGTPIKTMYERPDIKPFAFCPKCGCREYYGTGNKTAYPEHWEYFYCLRCDYLVAEIDNSPFIHCLEEIAIEGYTSKRQRYISKFNSND